MQTPARRKRLIQTLTRLASQREQERDRLRMLLMSVERELDEIAALIARDNQTLDPFIGMIGKRRAGLRQQAETLRESIRTLSLELKREERQIDDFRDGERRAEAAGEEIARDEALSHRLSSDSG